MNKLNYIFDVVGDRQLPMRGFLDTKSQEIVIYDDSKGRELFRIGGQGQNSYQPQKKTKRKLATLTFVITNGSNTRQTATLFGSNLEPLIQPLGINVSIKEIENQAFNTHNYLRRDILSKKLKVVGFSYYVGNTQQFNNDLQFGTIKPYGVVETIPLSPLNYINRQQQAPLMIDLSDKFNWTVGARSVLYVPIEAQSSVTLMFKVIDDVEQPIVNQNRNNRDQVSGNFIDASPGVYKGNPSNNLSKYTNFDGSGGSTSGKKTKSNTKTESIISLMKLMVLTTGVVLIVDTICKNFKAS